ncbi:MAG TPA: phosphoenolpyruvate--protein phosphotransferase [Spirochaetia bacterium]|nr:phosphoenolpyruvate--protein phosphotransferase [Spirochaetia bacterium]
MATRRDNIELVWSISELSSLFEKKTNIDGFLQDVVDRIAEHMQSDVCSIYLLDETTGSLMLRATRGLDPASVGAVHLDVGEGITGTAVKELRPIREARASRNPDYKYIPDTREEQYESFLAVPIRRGLNRIGALVAQHRRPDQFTRQDTRALQAIAGQLASTLENVEMLMELHAGPGDRVSPAAARLPTIPCHPASEGIAVGSIMHLHPLDGSTEGSLELVHDDEERAFREALERTDGQLEAIQRELDERIADLANLIFASHLLMLRDEEFSGQMISAIRDGARAHDAIRQIVGRYVDLLSASTNPRTREKTHDIRDLGQRLLRNLRGDADEHGDLRGRVVIAHEMFPSDLVRVSAQHVEGVILTGGGTTAHLSILARSLEVPAVLLRSADDADLHDGDLVAIDAYEGLIHRDPPDAVLEQFRLAREAHRGEGERVAPSPATTSNGVRVELLANVNILHDVEVAVRVGATGIGLYRSEFPFLVRNDFPSEAEQYRIYHRITERIGDGPIVLRTLDVGGDKLFSDTQHLESNPFLGLRGIRFSLAHPELFDEQLRAMLRAGAGCDLRILFPMISSVDEFRLAKGHVDAVLADLADEGLPHHREPRLGIMVELPSAIECSDDLAAEVDFMSVGSNDLVMYLLAVDRANEQVESLYEPHHPAVFRALARVIASARRHGTPISICGEAGGDPAMIRFLIGCGLRSISADPARIPAIRSAIATISSTEAEDFARRITALPTVDAVAACIAERR